MEYEKMAKRDIINTDKFTWHKGDLIIDTPKAPANDAVARKRAMVAGKRTRAEPVPAAPEPKKRGRPLGSKNKPKVDEMKTQVAAKRGRGQAVVPPVDAPRRRGRPVGSKNKAKVVAPAVNDKRLQIAARVDRFGRLVIKLPPGMF
jgi:hypothetical protein